ncbi:MAG: tRNA glutamyl-Q(34) synthetase GluQRS [Beijerinckiaceae bacterium]|nr:tRNA glutamyl-Q(34) synthetase GluQRS [Beijerinckiaceae bacterium]MCZ8301839.1 tRNA glutamyl-Q(34) synthetase GluQRS [Beijerinckiaceae bacterium]
MSPVFRFAPSPNGFLHLGHACSALLNAELARRAGGRFLVRIEDIDTTRCREDLVEACLEDLAWLGLAWEQPVLRQRTRFPAYRAVAERLEAEGLLYPCFCTRGEIIRATGPMAARDPDGATLYPGTCRPLDLAEKASRLGAGAPFALRLDMAKALARFPTPPGWMEGGLPGTGAARHFPADPAAWGDCILIRKEIPASYHLAVVLDDALQGVTHVVRGQDLFAATSVHRLLQEILGLPAPSYWHHPLIAGPDGKKLSKSLASKPLRQYRAEGASPSEIRAMAGIDRLLDESHGHRDGEGHREDGEQRR